MHLLIFGSCLLLDDAIFLYKYLNRVYFDCKTQLCLIVPSFYLQGILNDITEQDTSFLDCKHKHMMKSGAPPDKVGVLHRLLPIEFHGFTSRINSKDYHSLVPGLISIF